MPPYEPKVLVPGPVTHAISPHHHSTGEWWCYVCKRRLKGSFMNPVIPWEHRPDNLPKVDKTPTPGLSTEGS